VVDGAELTTMPPRWPLSVTGTVLGQTKARRSDHKFKNKTGYHKRQGHRQKLTRVEVTGISK